MQARVEGSSPPSPNLPALASFKCCRLFLCLAASAPSVHSDSVQLGSECPCVCVCVCASLFRPSTPPANLFYLPASISCWWLSGRNGSLVSSPKKCTKKKTDIVYAKRLNLYIIVHHYCPWSMQATPSVQWKHLYLNPINAAQKHTSLF